MKARLSRSLILPTVALLVIATIGLAACVAINEAVTERELMCLTTPDDLCVRIVDLATSEESLDDDFGPPRITRVRIAVTDCAAIGREATATRCWRVTGTGSVGNGTMNYEFGRWVYERPDGTLGVTG